MMYCCVPTTSNLPCCQASSLLTLPVSNSLQHHAKMMVSSVKAATFKVPLCSHFGWLDDCKSDCHQIMKPFHTCLVLDHCTSQQKSPAELAQLLDLLFSCFFCLQGTSPFSQTHTKAVKALCMVCYLLLEEHCYADALKLFPAPQTWAWQQMQ